jgi:mannose PTS system EIIA component
MFTTIIVTHGKIGLEMIRAAESIVKEKLQMHSVSIEHGESLEEVRTRIKTLVEQHDEVLILTDMFGGTPSNLCLPFLNDKDTEVVTGVNLPMLIKLAHHNDHKSLKQTATFIKKYGQKNITLASKIIQTAQEQ